LIVVFRSAARLQRSARVLWHKRVPRRGIAAFCPFFPFDCCVSFRGSSAAFNPRPVASTPRVLHLIPILVVVLSFHLIVCVSFCGVAAAFCLRPVASTHAAPRHHGAAAFCINACHATDDAPRLIIRATDGAAHRALAPALRRIHRSPQRTRTSTGARGSCAPC